MSEPREPVTEAKQTLLDDFAAIRSPSMIPKWRVARLLDAIEAAARADALAEVRRGVEGLRGIDFERPEGWLNLVDRVDVLALLDPPK